VVKKTFGPKTEEVAEGRIKLLMSSGGGSRTTFFARHHYDIQIKKEDDGGTCDIQNKRNAQKILSKNFEGKSRLARPILKRKGIRILYNEVL